MWCSHEHNTGQNRSAATVTLQPYVGFQMEINAHGQRIVAAPVQSIGTYG